jgi:hypothetical protein
MLLLREQEKNSKIKEIKNLERKVRWHRLIGYMAESTCEVAKDRLSHLQTGELERCVGDHKVIGIALILTKGEAIVAIFGNERLIGQTTVVKRGLNLVGVPTGKKLQGRVIDTLGNVIDGLDVTKREESKLYAIAEAPVSPAYRGTINNSFGIVGMISAEIVGGINRAINNYKQEELNRRASELTSSEAEMLDIQIYQDQAKVYTSSRAGWELMVEKHNNLPRDQCLIANIISHLDVVMQEELKGLNSYDIQVWTDTYLELENDAMHEAKQQNIEKLYHAKYLLEERNYSWWREMRHLFPKVPAWSSIENWFNSLFQVRYSREKSKEITIFLDPNTEGSEVPTISSQVSYETLVNVSHLATKVQMYGLVPMLSDSYKSNRVAHMAGTWNSTEFCFINMQTFMEKKAYKEARSDENLFLFGGKCFFCPWMSNEQKIAHLPQEFQNEILRDCASYWDVIDKFNDKNTLHITIRNMWNYYNSLVKSEHTNWSWKTQWNKEWVREPAVGRPSDYIRVKLPQWNMALEEDMEVFSWVLAHTIPYVCMLVDIPGALSMIFLIIRGVLDTRRFYKNLRIHWITGRLI